MLAANQSERTREMSTKTLADVVEALIGASYLDGTSFLKSVFPFLTHMLSPETCLGSIQYLGVFQISLYPLK